MNAQLFVVDLISMSLMVHLRIKRKKLRVDYLKLKGGVNYRKENEQMNLYLISNRSLSSVGCVIVRETGFCDTAFYQGCKFSP